MSQIVISNAAQPSPSPISFSDPIAVSNRLDQFAVNAISRLLLWILIYHCRNRKL